MSDNENPVSRLEMEKMSEPKKRKPGSGRKPRINWLEIREDYIDSNLYPDREKPVGLLELAEKYGVAHSTIRNRSAKEDWQGLLKKRRDEVDRAAGEVIKRKQIVDEAKIRENQIAFTGMILGKGVERINNMKSDELTPMQALRFAIEGMEAQRKAAGLPTHYDPNARPDEDEGTIVEIERFRSLRLELYERLTRHERPQS